MTSSEPRDPAPGRPKADSAKGYEGAPAWPMGQERSDRGAPFRQKNIPSPNDAARGAYARFIPREELNGFAAWQPGDLAGGPAPQANVQRAPDEAPKVDVAAQLAAQLKAARQAGYQDGYGDGLVALDGFKQSFAAQTTAQIGALLQSLGDELGGLQQDMARTLAISATHLARQIVRAELASRPELVAQVAQEAVDTLLLSARHITLRVHPDDHAFVAQGAADVLAARGARLLADPSMSRGGCVVESDIGIIDASLETRWRRAAASLGCDEGWDGVPGAADGEGAAP
ncbi:MAG: flagellar assembly protein FliH [Pseudomonadota bacterium]